MTLSRRRFIAASLAAAAGTALGGYAIHRMGQHIKPAEPPATSKVFIADASNRSEGIERLLEKFDAAPFKGAKVALKANYNSGDPFPASTHIETLSSIVEVLKSTGASEIVMAERSGMGNTREVLEIRGVFKLADRLGFKAIPLDEILGEGWLEINHEGLHWLRGFKISKIFTEADVVVQTCCLKTHRFGGHITMSLKNSVGMVAKKDPSEPYDYMIELHTSPFQRLMIAEINRFYNVGLVVMDATQGFTTAGPEQGTLVKPNLILASMDRVAIDAVGVALLRSYGSTDEVMRGHIFNLEQISRAAELGVGVRAASGIRLAPLDKESEIAAGKIQAILDTQG